MRVNLSVTVEVDADDYRARLRDDVAKPTDAEIAEYVRQGMSVSGFAFNAVVTARLDHRTANALRAAYASVQKTSERIRARYEEAERTDDYSDADELGADDRERLHEEFQALMDLIAEEHPELTTEDTD